MPIALQDGIDLVHAGQVLGRAVLEPSDSARVPAIKAPRLRAVEPGRRFKVLLEPRQMFSQDAAVGRLDMNRIAKLVGETERVVLHS